MLTKEWINYSSDDKRRARFRLCTVTAWSLSKKAALEVDWVSGCCLRPSSGRSTGSASGGASWRTFSHAARITAAVAVGVDITAWRITRYRSTSSPTSTDRPTARQLHISSVQFTNAIRPAKWDKIHRTKRRKMKWTKRHQNALSDNSSETRPKNSNDNVRMN